MSDVKSCDAHKENAVMNTKRMSKAWLFAVMMWTAPAYAGAAHTLTLSTGSMVWLEGDSTLHPFTSKTSDLGLTADVAPADPSPNDMAALLNGGVKQMQLTIPVKSLKSKEAAL